MKTLFVRLALTCLLVSAPSCTGLLVSHRMKAAQRKLLTTWRLQQEGRWDEALDMSRRMHSSVSKSVQAKPARPDASGRPVNLLPLLTAWESGPHAELQAALSAHAPQRAASAMHALRQQCINCHLVAGQERIQLPELR